VEQSWNMSRKYGILLITLGSIFHGWNESWNGLDWVSNISDQCVDVIFWSSI